MGMGFNLSIHRSIILAAFGVILFSSPSVFAAKKRETKSCTNLAEQLAANVRAKENADQKAAEEKRQKEIEEEIARQKQEILSQRKKVPVVIADLEKQLLEASKQGKRSIKFSGGYENYSSRIWNENFRFHDSSKSPVAVAVIQFLTQNKLEFKVREEPQYDIEGDADWNSRRGDFLYQKYWLEINW